MSPIIRAARTTRATRASAALATQAAIVAQATTPVVATTQATITLAAFPSITPKRLINRRSSRVSKPPQRFASVAHTAPNRITKKRSSKTTRKPSFTKVEIPRQKEMPRLVFNLISQVPGDSHKARFALDPNNKVDPSRGITQITISVAADMPLEEYMSGNTKEITILFGDDSRWTYDGDSNNESSSDEEADFDRREAKLEDEHSTNKKSTEGIASILGEEDEEDEEETKRMDFELQELESSDSDVEGSEDVSEGEATGDLVNRASKRWMKNPHKMLQDLDEDESWN